MREVTPSRGAIELAKTDGPWRGIPWACPTCGVWWVVSGWDDTNGELEYGSADDHAPDQAVTSAKTSVTCQTEGCSGIGWIRTSVPNPWYDPAFLTERSPWDAQMGALRSDNNRYGFLVRREARREANVPEDAAYRNQYGPAMPESGGLVSAVPSAKGMVTSILIGALVALVIAVVFVIAAYLVGGWPF